MSGRWERGPFATRKHPYYLRGRFQLAKRGGLWRLLEWGVPRGGPWPSFAEAKRRAEPLIFVLHAEYAFGIGGVP